VASVILHLTFRIPPEKQAINRLYVHNINAEAKSLCSGLGLEIVTLGRIILMQVQVPEAKTKQRRAAIIQALSFAFCDAA
ncbi:Hypothetical predicted protein, partial [Podarcis lilfordi]